MVIELFKLTTFKIKECSIRTNKLCKLVKNFQRFESFKCKIIAGYKFSSNSCFNRWER